MAAGRGTRMMPLTQSIPKAMAPYDGSTLIAKGIKRVRSHVPNVYVTVGYKGALLAEHVISHGVTGLFDTSGMDNAWWIFHTLMQKLDEPVFVLTCDNVTSLDFNAIEDDYFRLGAPACMVIPVTPIEGLDGDFIHHVGNVVSMISRSMVASTYCSGVQVLNPKAVTEIVNECDNFYDVWAGLIAAKQLYCSTVQPETWFVADTIDQLLRIPGGF
jgi:NDP-sugar pyrophosphorylase family protein